MKKIFTSTDSSQVGLMQSVLEQAGITCEIRNDMVAQLIPVPLFASELWILRDEDQDEAEQVIAAFQPPASAEAD
jgi:Putative prokaryotic signal transducing protein